MQFRFRKNDSAVSPIIAVILMVAITVVLAATVYVWVSGFGQSGQQAKNLSLTQAGTIVTTDATAAASCAAGATWCVNFTVVSASPNFAGNTLRVTDGTSSVGAITCLLNGAAASATSLMAGDKLTCYGTGATDAAAGDALHFADSSAGSVVATLTLHT